MRHSAAPFLLALVSMTCGAPSADTARGARPAFRPGAEPQKPVEVPAGRGKSRFFVFVADVSPRDVLDLGARGRLLVGEGGERWLVEKEGASPVPAHEIAPEELVAARERDGKIVLVGASGTVYLAPGPLADFEARRPPQAEMRSVSAGRDAIVGVTRDGRVLRTDDAGATWSPVALPKTSTQPFAAMFTPRGEGLLLAAPQRVFVSQDDGRTFAPLASPVAARELHRGKDDALFVEGSALATKTKDGASYAATTAAAKLVTATDGAAELVVAPKTSPLWWTPVADDAPILGHAEAVAEGRAAIVRGALHEAIAAPSGAGKTVALASTEPGKKTVVRAIASAPEDCVDLLLTGGGGILYAGCTVLAEKSSRALRMFRSDDGGATFVDAGAVPLPAGGGLRAWALGSKGYLVTRSDALIAVRAGGETIEPVIDEDRTISRILDVRATASGDRVFVLAVEEGVDDRLALLVSKDSGRSFAVRSLPALDPDVEPSDAIVGFGLVEAEGRKPAVSVFLSHDGTQRYETRDDGATFERTEIPMRFTLASIAGAHGLATDGIRGFETIDSGRTWTSVRMPTPRKGAPIEHLACSDAGCVLGARGVRVGWELAGPEDLERDDEAKKAEPALAVRAWTCKPAGEPIPLGTPGGVQVQIGLHGWVAVRDDVDTGETSVVVPDEKANQAFATRTIPLLPATDAKTIASVTTSPEGAVALRFAAKQQKGERSDVELAWYVASTGKVHRAKIAGGAEAHAALHWPEPGGRRRAKASAVIVPGLGLWVRPSVVPGNDELWLVREGTGAPKRVTVPKAWPWELDAGVRVAGGSLLAKVHREWNAAQTSFTGVLDDAGQSWTPVARQLWPEIGTHPVTSYATIDGAPSLVVATAGDAGLPARTWALRLDGKGEPEPLALPTIDALGVPERVCPPGGTEPVVGLPARGLVVRAGDEALRAYAGVRVLARLAKEPCATTIVATLSGTSEATDEQIVVPLADPAHGVLFRTLSSKKKPKRHEAVPVACAP